MTRIAKADEYHEHLENCRQCASNPFDLCQLGNLLLIGAAADALALSALGQTRAQPIRTHPRRAAGGEKRGSE